MKEIILESIKQKEKDLELYYAFINDLNVSKQDRSVVSFKLMNEMIALQTLNDLVPEYSPAPSTGIIMAQGLGGVAGYVSILDNKVTISEDYAVMLSRKDEYLKMKADARS